jgi:uncharacterized glyoxalase superfamily protein PhnB/predicted kinase
MNDITSLCPLLVVRGAADAIHFYQRALGARVLARYEHGIDRRISHADLALGDRQFSLSDELPLWNSDAPTSLGGSPVVLQLGVVDAEAAVHSLCAAGASIVSPLQPFAGELTAHVRDPFGHLWIVRQLLETLSVDEIQRRRDELFAPLGDPTPTPPKDTPTIGNATATPQARNAGPLAPPPSARVHLVIGPVGAGKSTFALQLAQERSAIRLTLDEWMATLFRPDRPETDRIAWYRERAQRCIDQICKLVQQLTAQRHDVVLEIGLLQRDERERFYARLDEARLPLTLYVLDAARDIRRERVSRRNREQGPTFSMVVPPEIFELASDLWEPPEGEECEGRDVRFSWTDGEGGVGTSRW